MTELLPPSPSPRRVRRGFVIALVVVASVAALLTAQRAWLYHETRLLNELVQRLRAAGEPAPFFHVDLDRPALEAPDAIRYYLAAAQLAVPSGAADLRGALLADAGPDTKTVDAACRLLAANRDALDLATRAATLDVRPYNPYDDHLRSVRDLELHVVLSVQTLLAARTGTASSAADAAVVELRALRLREVNSRWLPPVLLSLLLRGAASDAAVVLGRSDLSALDLTRLSGELARHEPEDLVAREFSYERALALDDLPSISGWLGPLLLRERRRYVEFLGAVIDAARGPEGQRLTAIERLASQDFSTTLLPTRGFLDSVGTSRIRQLTFQMLADVALDRAALSATAVERYRRDHGGALPPSIEALAPEYLPNPPLDPANGLPLRLEPAPDGYVVYGVGADRKDDGGRITPAEPAERERLDRAPDWGLRVRWLPPPEGRTR